MKGIVLAAAIFLAGTPATTTLKQQERDKAVAELEGSKKMFLDATQGLSAAQWNFKPSPERWTVAECATHIALTEGFVLGFVTDQVLKSPATPEKREATNGKDELVVKMMQDRSHKATPPEQIDPTKKPMKPEESVKAILDSHAKIEDFVKTTHEDLRDHMFDHPVPAIGTLDAYQWVLLISAHTRRHTLQILELKADPNFPKQ